MPSVSDDQTFIATWKICGGIPSAVAARLGVTERAVFSRRNTLETKGFELPTTQRGAKTHWAYNRTHRLALTDAVVVIYSDAHYWPGEEPTLAFRALVRLIRKLKPDHVIANGDLGDFPRISKFGRIGWEKLPSVQDELAYIKERQKEIADASGAARWRTVGNHDMRFDRFLANQASDYAGVPGTRFADFLPDWPEYYSIRLNDAVVKHRWNGGIHAAYNNAVRGQATVITGHTHRLMAVPFRGFGRRHWGIETGTLATNPQDVSDEGNGPFEYGEDAPHAGLAGFAVLTFRSGVMMPPEFCYCEGDDAWFRGRVL